VRCGTNTNRSHWRGGTDRAVPGGVDVLAFLAVLLLIWLALIVLGAVIKGLFWLIIVGAVLFVATAAYGWVKQKARSSSR
jgi:hypothetical protein